MPTSFDTTLSIPNEEDRFDLLPFGVCVIDRNLGIHAWNATMVRWTGISQENALLLNLGDEFPLGMTQNVRGRLDDVFEFGSTVVFSPALHASFIPVLIIRDDPNSWMIQRAQVRPIDNDRNLALVVIEDVTVRFKETAQLRRERHELKTSESRLKAQQIALVDAKRGAEAANRSKSEFLSNMSHELRTPMTAILGYADLLLDTAESPEQTNALRTIKRNGEHLLAIVNDILDLSKIDSGKLAIERIMCDPVQLVGEVFSLMRLRAHHNKLSLDAEFSGEIPSHIRTDPTRLRQVLLNLIGNAIKFTDSGGVRLTVQLVRASAGDHLLRFDVADTGIGMTPSQQDQLFQPFTQADSSTTRRFGGTGLGLSVSKRLVELLGGTISAESVYGKGSTFSFTVETGSLDKCELFDEPNLALRTLTATVAGESSTVPQLDCRVLLAEDSPDIQRLTSFMLKKAGAKVTLAENGQIACKVAMQAVTDGNPFDVILMDMQMPVQDGYEATRELRNQNYHGPIIALTAHAMADDQKKCLDAGCDDYATKPIDRERLILLIDQYARNPERQTATAT